MTTHEKAREKTASMLQEAGMVITEAEKEKIEIAEFGLPGYPLSGLQLLTNFNSPRYCAKELVLFPGQTCPEHLHPPFNGTPGKQETFRCRWGEVYLFVDDPALALNHGEVASEFSSESRDDLDIFTDPRVRRVA